MPAEAHIERERKFLVDDPDFLAGHMPERIAQAYIVSNDQVELRVRLGAGTPLLTVKSGESYIAREEFEYELGSLALANALFDSAAFTLIKDRYSVVASGNVWDVDVFLGRNEGLTIAEIEFDEGETLTIPEWCSREVTGDEKYYNRSLAIVPFDSWQM